MSFTIKYSINIFLWLMSPYMGLGLLICKVLNHTWTQYTW